MFATLSAFTIQTPLALLLLVAGFGFIIFIHELGHFLVAKAVGIKVSQFALGFGHALLAYRKGMGVRVGSTEPEFNRRVGKYLEGEGIQPHPHAELEIKEEILTRAEPEIVNYTSEQVEHAAKALGLGETEYRLNYLPLGGYVKMLGQEDLDPAASSADPRSYTQKPVWARLAVVSAGVIMNAIFAVLFFVIAFTRGLEFPPPVIGQVAVGSPAATTPAERRADIVGLREGDVILTVNGKRPDDFNDLFVASALAARDQKIAIDIERQPGPGVAGGQFTFRIAPAQFRGQPLRVIGVTPPRTTRLAAFDEGAAPLPEIFRKLKLRPGMELKAIDDQPVHNSYDIARSLGRANGKPLTFVFTDKAGDISITRTPQTDLMAGEGATPDRPGPSHLLGLVPLVRVEEAIKGKPADGRLVAGDLVLKVNSTVHPASSQIIDAIQDSEGKPVEFLVLRDGIEKKVTVSPRLEFYWFGQVQPIGIIIRPAVDTNYIASVLPGSAFAGLDLITPARIQSVNGQPTENYSQLRAALAASGTGGSPVEIGYSLPLADGGQDRHETRRIVLTDKNLADLASVQWDVELPPFEQLLTMQKATGVADAVHRGLNKTLLYVIQTYQTLDALLSRTVSPAELRGPVGIAHAGTQLTRKGVNYLMFFLGLISVNLAVLNFLPLPILDGGLAVLLLLEKIRGRPVSPNVQIGLSYVGLFLLLTLVIYVTFHDIVRLVTNT